MGALFSLVHETKDTQVAEVLASKSVRVQQQFSALIVSGTGTGTIKSSQGWLARVVVGASANGGKLQIFDSAVASAIGANASSLADIDLSARGTYLYDVLSQGAFSYRLSAADAGSNVSIIYV